MSELVRGRVWSRTLRSGTLWSGMSFSKCRGRHRGWHSDCMNLGLRNAPRPQLISGHDQKCRISARHTTVAPQNSCFPEAAELKGQVCPGLRIRNGVLPGAWLLSGCPCTATCADLALAHKDRWRCHNCKAMPRQASRPARAEPAAAVVFP